MSNFERRLLLFVFSIVYLVSGQGCATSARLHQTSTRSGNLQQQLIGLSPRIQSEEAERLAQTAVSKAMKLAQEYRAVWPPWFHNVLVNHGLKERGLCFHWTNDLYLQLHELGLRSLDLHLAVARMDTPKEHNAIVVTASGQPFESGLVLDAWRKSGLLWSGPVMNDKYPWMELPRDRFDPRIKERL